MTGVDMLVAAHPSVRTIGDEWSYVWKQDWITFSAVVGETPIPKERKQINGPVQVGIIALHAFARYPEHFEEFTKRVKEIAQQQAA